jgi:hypothetical protein
MKRLALALTAAVTIALAGSGAAFADRGAPGSTYPEQPGSHVQTACQSVSTNPGTSNGGPAQTNQSDTAFAITGGLFTDACAP